MGCKGVRTKESRSKSRISAWETGLIHIHVLHSCLLPVLYTSLIHCVYCYHLVLTSSRAQTLKVYFLCASHRIWNSTDTVKHSAQCCIYVNWTINTNKASKIVKERTTLKKKYRITKLYTHMFFLISQFAAIRFPLQKSWLFMSLICMLPTPRGQAVFLSFRQPVQGLA